MKEIVITIFLLVFFVSANAQTKDTVSGKKYLSHLARLDLCADIDSERDRGGDSYKGLLKYIQEYADDEGISYKSPEELISKHFMKIKCFNTDGLKMRKKASLFKYSIEKRDYKFVRNALLIRNDDGERICNPNIDFSQTEIIDGKEESLIDFIDKILKEDGMSAVHNFPGLKTLKIQLRNCIEDRRQWFESKTLPESELRKKRLEGAMFSEGLADYRLTDFEDKQQRMYYGYIDRTGTIVIPLKYDYVAPFDNGLAAVQLNDKWGWINQKDEVIIPFKYDRVYSYYFDKDNTKIKVKIGDNCLYINRKGEEVRKVKCD